MKVIIIKDCKKGKVNEIVDVSLGYATNFLIKRGYALPMNMKTNKKLQDNIKAKEKQTQSQLITALKAKEFIEKLLLKFSLTTTSDKMVHGSITKKQIMEKLQTEGLNVNKYAIETIKINTIGISIIKIFINQNVVAKLKIEVTNDG